MKGALQAVVRPFFGICTLRTRPQDLPAAQALFIPAAAIYAISNAVLAATWMKPAGAMLSGALETVLMLLILHILLAVRRVPGRWIQTGSAISGTGVLFNLFGLPLFLLMTRAGASGPWPLAAYLAVLGLLAWNVAVLGHILRHALSIPMLAGVLLAIGYLWGVSAALSAFFPAQTAA